jgi:hypothetical protein
MKGSSNRIHMDRLQTYAGASGLAPGSQFRDLEFEHRLVQHIRCYDVLIMAGMRIAAQ